MRIETDGAGQGIGAVDRLDLDQSGLAVIAARHGAHERRPPTAAPARPENARSGPFNSRWTRSNETSPPRIARPCPREAVDQRQRDRTNASDGGDAERDAGEKYPKASKPPRNSRSATRKTNGQRGVRLDSRRFGLASAAGVSSISMAGAFAGENIASGWTLRNMWRQAKWTASQIVAHVRIGPFDAVLFSRRDEDVVAGA